MGLELWTYAPPSTPVQDLGSLEYHEGEETGKEQYNNDASTANRTFYVAWEDRQQFISDALGFSFIISTGAINRVLPAEHPTMKKFYAESATLEGIGVLGNDNDAPTWTTAKINVNYKPRTYAVKKDNEVTSELSRYTTKVTRPAGEYLTLNAPMKFVTSGDTLTQPPGRITTSMEVHYTWHDVPAINTPGREPFILPNLDKINTCIGKVNSDTFDVKGIAAPAETMLFCGVDPKMIMPRLSGDNYYWEITFQFIYRNNGTSPVGGQAGHNHIFDVKNNRWDYVTSDGTLTGNPLYQETDLNVLWTLDT